MANRFEELVRANYRFGRMHPFSGQDTGDDTEKGEQYYEKRQGIQI